MANDKDEYRPFVEIAQRKGKKIFLPGDPKPEQKQEEGHIHLDMDMVEESIRNTVSRLDKSGKIDLRDKFIRLLEKGTDAQKIDFVLGSGTYYFPEDLEYMAKLARMQMEAKPNCRRVSEPVCRLVCKCLTKNEQDCNELCREVTRIVCD